MNGWALSSALAWLESQGGGGESNIYLNSNYPSSELFDVVKRSILSRLSKHSASQTLSYSQDTPIDMHFLSHITII